VILLVDIYCQTEVIFAVAMIVVVIVWGMSALVLYYLPLLHIYYCYTSEQ
jgi:hypothetical protein